MLRRTPAIIALVTMSALTEAPVAAKVVTTSLVEMAQRAEFIGIVRVDRIGLGIPLVRRPRATATILDSWKGQAAGRVTFVAAPTWTCDISDAKRGEEIVVFIREGRLLHAGRGRMPIFTRDNTRLAAIWPEVTLPGGVHSEDGPEPEYHFIRAVGVSDLRDAIARLLLYGLAGITQAGTTAATAASCRRVEGALEKGPECRQRW